MALLVMRARPLALALLLVATVGTASAAERVQRGMRAPALEPLAQLDAPGFSLPAARGHFVLLQFFSVRCAHCQEFAPRLSEIHARYASRGLFTIGVTRESREEVEVFRRKHGATYPVVIAPFDVQRAYGVEAYPTGFLLAPNGRVLWRGKPDRMRNRVIEAYLEKFRQLPELPASQAAVRAAIQEGRYADAHRALLPQRACLGIDKDACAQILDTLAWLDGFATASLEAARRDEEAARWHDAWQTYDEIARGYAGLAPGREAAARCDRLLADPARAREIAAGRALAEARSRARLAAPAAGAALLAAVARAHEGTAAGKLAAELAGRWAAQ